MYNMCYIWLYNVIIVNHFFVKNNKDCYYAYILLVLIIIVDISIALTILRVMSAMTLNFFNHE